RRCARAYRNEGANVPDAAACSVPQIHARPRRRCSPTLSSPMAASTANSRPFRRLAPEHAVTLAFLRVVVCAVVLASPEVLSARVVAARPAALRVAPEGLGWFVAHVPITPQLA